MQQWYDSANKKKANTKKKQLKIEDFRHAGKEDKQSRQDQSFSHQYALGSNHWNWRDWICKNCARVWEG